MNRQAISRMFGRARSPLFLFVVIAMPMIVAACNNGGGTGY